MNVLAIAHLGGRLELLDRIREIAERERPDMLFFAGGALGAGSAPVRTHAGVFAALEKLGVPSYCIPGEADGPERHYMTAAPRPPVGRAERARRARDVRSGAGARDGGRRLRRRHHPPSGWATRSW